MTANEIKESYYEGDRVYEISPQQPIPYMDVDIRNNYGEIVFVVTWIPGTPNYEKAKNRHKALI